MFTNPTLIVDFDGTLWDSEGFLRELYAVAERYGITPKAMLNTWEDSWSHPARREGYSARRHAGKLADITPRYSEEELHTWLEDHHARMGDFVYPDAHLFLHEMRTAGYSLILLSNGDPVWQRRKLAATGLEDHFDSVQVSRHPKEDVLRGMIGSMEHPHMLFVNDNPEENWAVAHSLPRLAQAMRVNRDRWPEEHYVRVGHPYFSTLDDVRQYAHEFFRG